jgi:mannitol/fructose-specific phosphotransferase system IIA component (Ntr-type)
MRDELIKSALVIDVLEARDKNGALDEMLATAVRAKLIAKTELADVRRRLLERESLGTTGIGNGVAVPHVKDATIKKLSIVLARSLPGIDYQSIDGKPVHTLFLLLAPADAAEEHLGALRWISGLARNTDFRRFFMAARTAAEIRDLLAEMSQKP